MPTCVAACSSTASCGWCASTAVQRGWWPSPARSAGSARVAARDAWPRVRGTGRGGVRPAACAAMGAELSVPLAFPVRQQARSHWPGAGHRAARDRRLVGRSSRHRPRQRPVRRGDADPAFRQRAEPEHPLPHAVARRRVRGSHRAAAARTAPAPRPCAHHRAVDPAGSCHRAPGVSAPDAQRLARRGGRIGLPGRQRCRRRQHGWAADEFDHLPHRHRPRRWLQGRHAANAAR